MRHPPTLSRRLRIAAALAAALALAVPGRALAYRKTFAKDALIIPTQLEYQSGDNNSDGSIAAYGLIYGVLAKNKARIAANKTPITIYWVVEPTKLSHHRCWTPDDGVPDYSKPNDNDGCDFQVVRAAAGEAPVARVKPDGSEESPFNANGIAYDSTNGKVTRSGTFQVGSGRARVKYSGGAWVIAAADRDAFLELLRTDAALSRFHKDGPGSLYVQMHSARAQFDAYVARAMNEKPPVIAIVGTGTRNILETYLGQAGIDDVTFPNREGTPASHGTVYDVLDPLTDFVTTATYPHGALNMPLDPTDASSPTYYNVLWAADWDIDSRSKLPAGWNDDDGKANALANIGYFVDQGNGLFAEDTSIVSLEGTMEGATGTCAVQQVCANDVKAEDTRPFTCNADFTPSACNACYQCPAGTTLDDRNCGSVACISECKGEAVCGGCYSCPAGETLDKSDCNHLKCVPAAGCPAGYASSTCGGCFSCPAVKSGNTTVQYLLNDSSCTSVFCREPCAAGYGYSAPRNVCYRCSVGAWDEAKGECSPKGPNNNKDSIQSAKTQPSGTPTFSPPTSTAVTTSVPTRADPFCDAGYNLTCPGQTVSTRGGSVDTRFQSTSGFATNGLNGSFSGPDCTDYLVPVGGHFHANPGGGHDCVDYHPGDGTVGLVFSQKGNFNFTSQTGGNVQDYKPEAYRRGTWRIASSGYADATGKIDLTAGRTGKDFASMRHKDGDPAKGLVVYLSGHQYKFDFWGLRLILNTLLNLGLSNYGTEIARSEPVGYKDPNLDKATVYQGTYVELPTPLFPDWKEYSPVSPSSWQFPYTKGHLYQYDLAKISSTSQGFGQNKNWDAALKMPAPGDRVIKTALGGSARLGWQIRDLTYAELDASGCMDADKDHKCDLAERLADGNTAGVNGSTLLASNDESPAGTAQRDLLGMFVQQVRGYCAALDDATKRPIMAPTEAQCEDLKQARQMRDRKFLGGIDHSSPAIVGPSKYVTGARDYPVRFDPSTRPVVAFSGARDGMLHAFYVSGGEGFPGLTAEQKVAGRELWAFIPPAQLPRLATNSAMVDAAVNVLDVFASFPTDKNDDGVIDWGATGASSERPTGIREWRTVLLAAAGEGGSELFAMDVTNPLRPVLLWHVSGPTDHDDKWDKPTATGFGNGTFADGDDHMDRDEPTSFALKWFDWDDGLAATKHIPTKFESTDADVLKEIKLGVYDYRNLGVTYGTSIGKVWEGNAYRYVAYVATNAADYSDASNPTGYKGLELFAIDLVTGEKLWQWEKMYRSARSDGTIIADNSIPGRPALADVDSDGSVDRIYVGDMEGRLWELSASDGKNLNYKLPKGGTAHVSYPLYGTPSIVGTGASAGTLALYKVEATGEPAQQPLTSPIGLGRFSDAKDSRRPYLVGRLSIVQGTMGIDYSITPFEHGYVHVLPIFPDDSTTRNEPDVDAVPDQKLYGLLKSAADWSIELDIGERVYGMPRIVNDEVVFNTAFGSFSDNVTLAESLTDRGNLVIASSKDDAPKKTANETKSFGGVLIFENRVVVSTASDLKQIDATEKGLSGDQVSQRPFNRYTPATMKTFEPVGNVHTGVSR